MPESTKLASLSSSKELIVKFEGSRRITVVRDTVSTFISVLVNFSWSKWMDIDRNWGCLVTLENGRGKGCLPSFTSLLGGAGGGLKLATR